MAYNFNQRPMPANLSLTGQRVLLEVRNSWMKNNPQYAMARQLMPENQSMADNYRIPSWNTQIANMPTQDLFNTKHISRHQDFNQAPSGESYQKINFEILQNHQQSVHYNPVQSLQRFHNSQDTPASSQLGINGGMAQKSYDCTQKSYDCTQKSIMLFENDDDNDQENDVMRVTDEGFHSSTFNNPEEIEDEDMFRSVGEETNSPPIELETESNSPPFIFQPVMCDPKQIDNNFKAQATETFMFKVPQAMEPRVLGGARSKENRSVSDQWLNDAKRNKEAYVPETAVHSQTGNARERDQEFMHTTHRFLCDSQYTSSRNATASGYALNGAFVNQALTSASCNDFNEDNENVNHFSQEAALEIEEIPVRKEVLNMISEENKNCTLPATDCLQSSPSANTRVDKQFISELLYKLNILATDNARQEEEQLALALNANRSNLTSTINIEQSKQEKPLPNYYIFKTPLKRSRCDSELSKKVQKLDLDKCEGENRIGNDGKLMKSHGNENLQRKSYHSDRNCAADLNFPKRGATSSESNILQDSDLNKTRSEKIEATPMNKMAITILTENKMREIESQLSTCELEEVALTIMYKEGVTQLDAEQGVTLVPSGLLLGLRTADAMQYCFLRDLQKPWMPAATIINFLSLLFTRPCPKVCIDAQAIFMYLVDKYSFTQDQVCDGRWMFVDPLVGGWLLDPDHPPSDFLSLSTSLLGKQSCANSGGREERACRLLELLSRTAAAVVTKLRQAGLYSVFTGLEMKLVPILAVMELRGIAVDTNKLRQMQAILESRLSEVSTQAYRAAGRKFSLNSTVQLRALLYDELHLDKGLHIKSTAALGAKSTAEPMLLLLAPLHPLPALVLRHRQLHKIKAAYVDGILEHSNNGAIFTSWEQTSCATGRITSNSPNVQTIPRVPIPLFSEHNVNKTVGPNEHGSLHMRSVFIPRPGFALVSADFCQVELRLFAHFAQDQTLLHAFRQQGDIFQHLAMLWLGPGETDEDRARQREKTKRVVYAVMYGAGAIKLSEFLQVSQQQASAIIDSFLGLVPALRRFPQQVVDRCRQHGFLRSLSGRLRKFPNIRSTQPALRKYSERQAINFLIQGSAADVCKAAMLATERCLQENAHFGARLLLQIHDELVWEVPCINVQPFKELISEVMQDTDTFCGIMGPLSVALPISVHTGDSWDDMS